MIKNIEKEVEGITKWIREYVQSVGAKGVVIGNSGGKDCATVIALATKALGKENILTIAMPCDSIMQDLDDAKLVSNKFGVELITIDITNAYKELETQIDNNIIEYQKNELREAESKINTKPRMRMTALYMIAQKLNYLVIGTGNLCERMVGYTTKWGDSSSDFNPIGNFTVEEVLQIGEFLEVPEKIIKKAPSDGLGKQTDEEKMGITYKQIEEYIETGKTEENAMKIIERKYMISKHKRNPIPMYLYNRKNYLEDKK